MAETHKDIKKTAKKTRAAERRGGADAEVGDMLRSVYQQTVEEGVPDDLMDLLNRLD